jgi:hypothetical protein
MGLFFTMSKIEHSMKRNCKKVIGWILFVVVCGVWGGRAAAQGTEGKVLYENNFEKAAAGALPEGMLALDGDFKVKETNGNKVLELPGAPAENFYGALFGPATNWGVCVSARIFGTGTSRRSPSFGVGLNGSGGYCLRVSPAKGVLEIYKGDEARTNAPMVWKTGAWTMLRLQVRATAGPSWMVEGKAWEQGAAEPKDWMVAVEEKTAPNPGRASLWGTPYSGTPIWFADLKLSEIGTR